MPESWRDQMRRYKERWIIGLAAVLSVLLHIVLIVLFMRFSFSTALPTPPKSMDIDLANFDAAKMRALQQQADQEEPHRLDFRHVPANQQSPAHPDAYGFQNNDAGRSSHRSDQRLEEIQRLTGPRGQSHGPGSSAAQQRGGQTGGQGSRPLPPIPQVGEGVGEPRQRDNREGGGQASGRQGRSVDQMLARAGMPEPEGGGGEGGADQFNPNVGEGGRSLSISTREYRYMSYFAHMKEKIEMAWLYPEEAQRGGQQGVATLRFTVLHSGQVKDVQVVRTSGFPLLDRYAVKAVNDAHFNPMPAEWPATSSTN